MAAAIPNSIDLLQRMVDAVELVQQRLAKATSALRDSSIPYALIGDSAVAAWVAAVDRAAVRNTQEVRIIIRRADLSAAQSALETAGFVHRRGANLFLDHAAASSRDAVALDLFEELARPSADALSVHESTCLRGLRVANLEPLARAMLRTFTLSDRVNLDDLISVGLIDQSWTAKLPAPLACRLQSLLNVPDG